MNKESLQKAITITKPTLGINSLIPGLDCYLFDGNKVTTFNGAITISTTMDFEFPVKGAILGDTFYKLINELGNEIELETTADDVVVVKYGNSKTRFKVQKIDTEFLNDLEESGNKTDLPTNVLFASGLKRCINSLGGKGSEAGINLFIEDNTCQMYSSNGYTSSRFVFDLPEGKFANTKVFLPAAFCEQLLNLYFVLNVEADEVTVSDKYIRAKFGTTVLRSSFYANPVNTELRSMIDDCIAEVPDVDLPEPLKDSVKRAEIISGRDAIITLAYNSEKTSISAKGVSGELNDEVELAYPMEGNLNVDVRQLKKVIESSNMIGFNPNYLVLQGNEGYYKYLVSARME